MFSQSLGDPVLLSLGNPVQKPLIFPYLWRSILGNLKMCLCKQKIQDFPAYGNVLWDSAEHLSISGESWAGSLELEGPNPAWEFLGRTGPGPLSTWISCLRWLDNADSSRPISLSHYKLNRRLQLNRSTNLMLHLSQPKILGVCGAMRDMDICLLGLCAAINIFIEVWRWQKAMSVPILCEMSSWSPVSSWSACTHHSF